MPEPSHSIVKSEASVSMLGDVVSSIVNVDVVVDSLPQSSVAVNVTVALPVDPQSSESAVKSLLQVTPEQTSLAEAPPFEFNQACKSTSLPSPSHSTVVSEASTSTLGDVVSAIVKVTVVVDSFPQSSDAVKVTVALPVAPQSSESAVKSLLQVTSAQLS